MGWDEDQAATRRVLEDAYRNEFDSLFAAAEASKGGKAYMDMADAYITARLRCRDAEEAQRVAEADRDMWLHNYDALSQRYLQARGCYSTRRQDYRGPCWPDGSRIG